MKPMLAKKYAKGKITFPCFVQPKLDGLRALYLGPDKLQSRSYGQEEELLWNPPVVSHILKPLREILWPLDGELYLHGSSLQSINSAIGVKRAEPNKNSSTIQYHVFDIIARIPFYERAEKLAELKEILTDPIHIVETIYCHSEKFSDECYDHFRSLGYEGMIYRDMDAPYGREQFCSNQENRWSCLLKRKERPDIEVEIVGVIESENFKAIPQPYIAALQVRWNGKVFSGGGGLTHAQKLRYFHEPPIGKMARITYASLSDEGIPLQPSTELVYD